MLGIDPGTRATGYGVIDHERSSRRLVECGVIRPRSTHLNGRLVDIHAATLGLIDRLRPDCVAIEGVFTGRNARTAMILGHARGVLVLAASLRDLPVHEYPPREVKKRVVGTGAATKGQVGFMVRQHLRLKETPEPADAADGCAIALCHVFAQTPGHVGPVVLS
ncbi:MAG: crossover junction endodeoxyribonuclease RuvC [Gemmatimonadetes bacterium]|nr:crossover junction endodeoxyribonuclease RuvC [Gemmatimonadota bacterium]